MNSQLLSVGNFFPRGLILSTLVFLSACSSMSSSRSGNSAGLSDKSSGLSAEKIESELGGEVSIKADRSHLEELRKDIPEEIKVANDELALIMSLMGEVKEKPDSIRTRFQRQVAKKREDFRRRTNKLRQDFNKTERADRDKFLKNLSQERAKFNKEKPDRETTRNFYSEQDLKRREFLSNQKDQRAEFEGELRARTKDFDEDVRLKTKEFNDQYRIYSQRFREAEKAKKDSARAKPVQNPQGVAVDPKTKSVLKEFEEMKAVPGTALGADSE